MEQTDRTCNNLISMIFWINIHWELKIDAQIKEKKIQTFYRLPLTFKDSFDHIIDTHPLLLFK